MVLSLLYGKKYNQAKVGSVELEVTLRENHSFSSQVTSYPIEDGSILSDHIINNPNQLVLEGIVSDTPLNILSFFNRSVDTFNKLIEIHENREIVTVVTGLKTYQNMAITSLNVPREIRTGQSLRFTIELQEIILDTTVRFVIDQQNIFGGVQSKIPESIVKSNEQIPFLDLDPVSSLKDQSTSGFDYGIQQLQPIPPTTLTKVNESLTFLGVAI